MAKSARVILHFLLFMTTALIGQTNGDYRSNASNVWSAFGTWQYYNNGWTSTSVVPTVSMECQITIRSGHSVSHNVSNYSGSPRNSLTIEGNGILNISNSGSIHTQFKHLTIETGGVLNQVSNGVFVSTQAIISGLFVNTSTKTPNFNGVGVVTGTGVYVHGANGGTIPTADWEPFSKLRIIGVTQNIPVATGTYQNVEWNCQNQNTSLVLENNLNNINGNFEIMNTGTGVITLSNVTESKLLTVGGSFCLTDGVFALKGATQSLGSHGLLVNNNYIQSGGIFQMNRRGDVSTGVPYMEVHGNFSMTGGNITNTNATHGVGDIIFNGSGIQFYSKTGGTISNKINFIVNPGSILDLGTSVIDGSTGSFTLKPGSGLITAHPEGISTSGILGSIQVSGSRVYPSEASYTYNGSLAQVTGNGLPGVVQNLTIDNPAGISLSKNVVVNGTLSIGRGALNCGDFTLGLGEDATVEVVSSMPSFVPQEIAVLQINGDETITLPNSVSCGSLILDTQLDLSSHEVTVIDDKIALKNGVLSSLSMSDQANTIGANMSIPRTWTINGFGISRLTFVVDDLITGQSQVWRRTANSEGDWIPVGSPQPVVEGKIIVHLSKNSAKAEEEWTITDGSQTLPVVLSSFSSSYSPDGNVRLMWITQSETNLHGFYLYRSITNSDSDMILISSLIPGTNTSTTQCYVYSDSEIFEEGEYYYWLQSIDFDGTETMHKPILTYYHPVDNHGGMSVPLKTGLDSVYPNPFNPSATIAYSLAHSANVSIRLYNHRGQLIRSFDPVSKASGTHTLQWDGKDNTGAYCASGIYRVVLNADGRMFTRMITIIK